MNDEKELQIRNYEEEITILHGKNVEASQTLTNTLKEIDSKKAEFDEYCLSERSKLKAENDRLDAVKKELEIWKETISIEEGNVNKEKLGLFEIRKSLRIANKELGLANNRVLKAKDEFDEIMKQKEEVSLELL